MTVYATETELNAYLGSTYPAPETGEATRMLTRASELIDNYTRGRAQLGYDGDLSTGVYAPAYVAVLVRACCAQVEFWLEAGEEHDIIGLHGAANVGRVNISQLPSRLAPRAADALLRAGLITAKVAIA